MAVPTYDPKKIIVTFGTHTVQGYADGDFLDISPTQERNTRNVGADGNVSRTMKNDNTDIVTITIKQTSKTNDVFSQIAYEDRVLGTGVKPLTITDVGGTSLAVYPEAWIASEPPMTAGNEEGDRAWVLHTGQPSAKVIGGNF